MRIVVQRVQNAEVKVSGEIKGKIAQGLLIFLGIETEDHYEDVEWLCKKLISLRIFNDLEGKMNLCIREIENSGFLVISQFTLHASVKKGNRPSFIKAARPETAIPLYNYFIKYLTEISGLSIESGEFGADMQVYLLNDGPVTIFMDSKMKE